MRGPWEHLLVGRAPPGPGPGRRVGVKGGGRQRPSDTHLGVMVRIRMPMKRFFQSGDRALGLG